MPEIREILVVVNMTEVRAGTQALNDLADASGGAGNQAQIANSKIRTAELLLRAQAEASKAAAEALKALGDQSNDASDALFKGLTAVNEFAKASIKVGQAGLSADIGKIKDGLGEMANASGLTEMALTRLGKGPLLALQMAAEVAAFVADAFVKGQMESDKFSRSLALTGNAAGITEGQFNTMVASAAESGQGGLGDARVALQTLVDTGQFTSESLTSVGAAALTMAQMNGQSAGAVAADFATMADGVVKWVDTHDSKYNILTAAQYQHIDALEKEGKTQQAMVEVSDLINAGLQKRAEKLSLIGTLLQGSKNLWSSFMDGMHSIGREETPDDEIRKINRRTAEVRMTRQLAPGTHPAARLTDAQLQQFEQQQAKALEVVINKKAQLEEQAREQQAESKRNADAKQALKDLDEMQKRYATRAQREAAEIKKFNESLENARAGGGKISAAKEADMRKNLLASFAGPTRMAALPAAGSDPREAKLAGELQAIQSELRLKTEGYEQLAKLDELRRKGEALSDDAYFESRRAAIVERGKAEVAAYQKQAEVLQASHAKTPQGVAENQNKIAEAEASKVLAAQKVAAELAQLDETARQTKDAAAKKSEADAAAAEEKRRADIKAADEKYWKEAADGAKAMGDAIEKAFGKVGGTIGKVATALLDYKKAQQEIQRTLANSKDDAKGDKTKEIAANAKAQLDSTQAQMKGYSDMAGAAAGFFDEQSSGYKALMTVSQVFHAAEVAMTLAELAPKAISAVLSQGQGDPYTAFGRMAAMAAIVAGLGVAIGGGGGGNVDVAKERQKANGTGTVLGDSSAKSDSIAKSLEIMEKNSSLGLAYSASMANSLRQVVAGIGGLGGLLVRNSGVTGATAPDSKGGAAALGSSALVVAVVGGVIGLALDKLTGGLVGKITGGVLGSIFGGKTSTIDTGLVLNKATLDAVGTGGVLASQYTDTKTSGGWFSKDKYRTGLNGLDREANDQFAKVILGLSDTVKTAAGLLGLGGDAFNARLKTFVVDLGKISLKDLKGDEIQKALEAAFSKLGDDMAKFGVGGLEKYQKVGEGYLETLARVANNYMQVTDVLAVLGKSFHTTGLAAVGLSEHLIEVAGGIDKLTSGTGFFVQNFLTEAERMAPITKSVNEAMGKLGLGGVNTMDGFKAAVLSAADGVAAGRAGSAELYASLLALAEPFKTAADYAAQLAAATGELATVSKSASEIASEHKDLQQQLNELTKSSAELLASQRAGIADVNKSLFDQIQAAKAVVSAKDALSKAYETESSAAKAALDKSKSWVATLNSLNASTVLGAQSTLTPEQKYAEARAQFEKTLAAANAGDTTAQSGLSAAEQAFLTASQVVNASDAKYAADYARVVAANQEALQWAAAQVDVEQASLNALEAQVSGLITINDSVLTVAQAIANLQAAMGGATNLGVKFSNPPAGMALDGSAAPTAFDAGRYSAAANAGSDALVAEIRGLRQDNRAMREELEGLRADQRAQTGAAIQATVESNASAARMVVDGVDKSARASAWANTVKGEYA